MAGRCGRLSTIHTEVQIPHSSTNRISTATLSAIILLSLRTSDRGWPSCERIGKQISVHGPPFDNFSGTDISQNLDQRSARLYPFNFSWLKLSSTRTPVLFYIAIDFNNFRLKCLVIAVTGLKFRPFVRRPHPQLTCLDKLKLNCSKSHIEYFLLL